MSYVRKRKPPEWYLGEQAIISGAVVASQYGYEYLKQNVGLPDIMTNVIQASTAMYGASKLSSKLDWKTGVSTFTTGLLAPTIGKALHRKRAHMFGPNRNPNPVKADDFASKSHQHAKAAKYAYKTEEERGEYNDTGGKFMKELSNDRMLVHEDSHSGDWTVSYRGTDPTSTSRGWGDIWNDLMIFTGTAARGLKTQASDFSDTATKTKQLIKLHKVMRPGSKMTLAGHSLGGSMVAHMMSDPKIAKYVDQAHAFSIGAGPWGHPSYPKHLHLHISDIDPISLFEKERSGATFHYHTGHSLAETHWQSRWEDRPYWEGYDYNTFTYEERDDLIETAPVPELESGAGWKDEL